MTPGTNLNQESITFEVVNWGNTLLDANGNPILDANGNTQQGPDYEPYTPEQVAAVNAKIAELGQTYPGLQVIGHSDVTELKNDPGPLWDMEASRAALGAGTTEQAPVNPDAVPPAAPPGSIVPGGSAAGDTITVTPDGEDTVISAGNGPAGGVFNTVAEPVVDPVTKEMTLLPSNGQPISEDNTESTAWMEGTLPGHQNGYLEGGGYGFGDDVGCIDQTTQKPCYDSYDNWTCHTCHTGTDIMTEGPTRFNALQDGTVVCAGSGGFTSVSGAGIGCNAYPDYESGGPGQLTIETSDGALITYGHVSGILPGADAVGMDINTGQAIGVTGGMNGPHLHAEVQLPIGPPDANGNPTYMLVDPNLYYSGCYCNGGCGHEGYCPDSQGPGATKAAQSGAPVTTSASVTTPAPAPAPQSAQGAVQTTAPAPQGGLGGAATAPAPAPAAQPYQAPQHVAPAPTTNTGQMYTDEMGRQYEYMSDGTTRLIYDPAW